MLTGLNCNMFLGLWPFTNQHQSCSGGKKAQEEAIVFMPMHCSRNCHGTSVLLSLQKLVKQPLCSWSNVQKPCLYLCYLYTSFQISVERASFLFWILSPNFSSTNILNGVILVHHLGLIVQSQVKLLTMVNPVRNKLCKKQGKAGRGSRKQELWGQ